MRRRAGRTAGQGTGFGLGVQAAFLSEGDFQAAIKRAAVFVVNVRAPAGAVDLLVKQVTDA